MKPDQTTPAGRMGLTKRLDRKRQEAEGKTKLLPVYRLPQVPDKRSAQ